ncbi:hypothetical protein HanPSC8_Chr03g0098171 [Helianthus annuus]|nr:hypothetical protein HanPSC8_Chr03g0098171 [Helianthus annuus]
MYYACINLLAHDSFTRLESKKNCNMCETVLNSQKTVKHGTYFHFLESYGTWNTTVLPPSRWFLNL